MTSLFRASTFAVLLAATLGAQARPQDAAPAEIPHTRVRGRVVDASSNLPIKGAMVVIQGRDDGDAETDFDGRFDFPEAPTGEQSISVHKSAYVDSYDRIRIPAGRELEGVRIELHRSAAITGRVTAADRSPRAGARVHVLQRSYNQGMPAYFESGPPRRYPGGGSDDRGIFRSWGLQPGAYVVGVDPVAEPGPRGTNVFSSSGLYYPNSASISDAARIRVEWGQVQEGIDLELGPAADTRVEGVVRTADSGGDCQTCNGLLQRQEGDAWLPQGFITIGSGGEFSISGLSPGHYALSVRKLEMRTSSILFGAAEFDVLSGQVTPLLVDIYGEQPVSGRIVLEGAPETVVAADAEPWRARVQFQPRFGDPLAAPMARGGMANVSGKGAEAAFELTPAAGRYSLRLTPPQGGYVLDVRIAGRPVESRNFTVPPVRIKDLVITVGFDAGKLAGRVNGDEAGAVEAGLLPSLALLRLIPQGDHARLMDDLTRSAATDGSFEFDGLPPGAYLAVAVPLETGRFLRYPDMGEKLAPWSKRVEIRPGQTTSVDLDLGPRLTGIE